MNKKKAVICSIMFYVLVFAAYIAVAYFWEVAFAFVQSIMCAALMYLCADAFYKWLRKESGGST